MAENWDKVARNLGYTEEESMWNDLYVKCSLSIEELHNRLGYGMNTIIRRLETCNIKRRSAGGARYSPNQKARLFHFDQRIVWSTTIKELAKLTSISTALISKYKNSHGGKLDGICSDLPHSGAGELRESKPNALSAGAGAGQQV